MFMHEYKVVSETTLLFLYKGVVSGCCLDKIFSIYFQFHCNKTEICRYFAGICNVSPRYFTTVSELAFRLLFQLR